MIKSREKWYFLDTLARYLDLIEANEREWSQMNVSSIDFVRGEIMAFCRIFYLDPDFFLDAEYWELKAWCAKMRAMSDDEFNIEIGECAA